MPGAHSADDRREMLRLMHLHGNNSRKARAGWNTTLFGAAPARSSFQTVVKRLNETGSLANRKKNRKTTVRTPLAQERVDQLMTQNPDVSIRQAAKILNISTTSIQKLMLTNSVGIKKKPTKKTIKKAKANANPTINTTNDAGDFLAASSNFVLPSSSCWAGDIHPQPPMLTIVNDIPSRSTTTLHAIADWTDNLRLCKHLKSVDLTEEELAELTEMTNSSREMFERFLAARHMSAESPQKGINERHANIVHMGGRTTQKEGKY